MLKFLDTRRNLLKSCGLPHPLVGGTDVDEDEAMSSPIQHHVTMLGNRDSWNSWFHKPTLYRT